MHSWETRNSVILNYYALLRTAAGALETRSLPVKSL